MDSSFSPKDETGFCVCAIILQLACTGYYKTSLSGVQLAGHRIHNIKHIPTAPEHSRFDQVKITSTLLWGVLGLNLGLDTACSNQFFCCPQSSHASTGIVPEIGARPFTSIFSLLYYLPPSICWKLLCSALLMASWRKLQNTLLSHSINQSSDTVGHATKRVVRLR